MQSCGYRDRSESIQQPNPRCNKRCCRMKMESCKAIRFFRERTTKPSRGSLSPYLLRRRRSPSLFFLSEPEKRERRWYLCHYLNIISGCRNLYLRCFGVTQPPHRNTPATIFAVTSDLASISALPFRYCCKSMMLHERSSQEESLYSTGLSFFTPEMISDLRYLYVSLVDERVG